MESSNAFFDQKKIKSVSLYQVAQSSFDYVAIVCFEPSAVENQIPLHCRQVYKAINDPTLTSDTFEVYTLKDFIAKYGQPSEHMEVTTIDDLTSQDIDVVHQHLSTGVSCR